MTDKTTTITETESTTEVAAAITEELIERKEAETEATVAIIEAQTEQRTEVIAAEAAAQIAIGEAEWQKDKARLEAEISALRQQVVDLQSQTHPSIPPLLLVEQKTESDLIPPSMPPGKTENPAETVTEVTEEKEVAETPEPRKATRRRFL